MEIIQVTRAAGTFLESRMLASIEICDGENLDFLTS